MLEGVLGYLWVSLLWPGVPVGLYAVLGAGAVLTATAQGPLSTVVLMMELTGRDRSFIVPLLLVASIATLVARFEPRSIYDARLTDEELKARRRLRESVLASSTFVDFDKSVKAAGDENDLGACDGDLQG
jgi:H+/Cl- antiporter ClcA